MKVMSLFTLFPHVHPPPPRPLTTVLRIHLFVQRVQLWANSDHRQGPGPGVRNDFSTPDVRARGDREGVGDRLTENG